MTKLKKIIFLMCLILLASCVNVFANDIEDETRTVVIGSDIENTPSLNVLKTALEALNNQDAETFFNCLYTTDDIYASAEDIREMWNETTKVVYFEVLEEKYRDDNMAAYLCFEIGNDGMASIYTEIIKRINGEWKKVAIPHEVMTNPYYESIILERNENTVEHDFSTYTQHPSKTSKSDNALQVEEHLQNDIMPMSYDQLVTWSNLKLPPRSTYTTRNFSYSIPSAGVNRQITLNLKQWIPSGEIPTVSYQLYRYTETSGYTAYGDSQTVSESYPDGSSASKRLVFQIYADTINNMMLEIYNAGTTKTVYMYGEAYNY